MNCPACNSPLTECEISGVLAHFCSSCGGRLHTTAAFREYICALQDSSLEGLPMADLLHRRAVPPHRIPRQERTCPQCGQPLRQFNYAYDSNIILDRCSPCDLIWADRDEMRKVAQYVKGHPTLDKLGKALAGFEEERAAFRDDVEEKVPMLLMDAMRYGMVPLGDEEKVHSFALTTVLLILVNAAIFLILPRSTHTIQQLGFIPNVFFGGRELHRLLTSLFVHANFLHLSGNLLFLWIFGDNIEDRFGKARFIFAYLSFGVVGNIAHAIVTKHPYTPCVGASGAISGLMGCYLIFFPLSTIRVMAGSRTTRINAFFYLAGWFVIQMVLSLFESSVAYAAHVGGFIAGAIVALLHRVLKGSPKVEAAGYAPPSPDAGGVK
jgi:membrane associated rhomboid family serine protease/Zn-finger nucleic acid-binding protein